MPKSHRGRAKAGLQEIWQAATREEALAAFDRFVGAYSAKYPKAAEKLTKDRDELLAFYDFPAEHWQHLRTTNPIESTFATVRHRTTRTRNCVSRPTFLGLAFKLIESAEQSWRRIRAPEKIASLLEGVPFKRWTTGDRQHTGSATACRLIGPRLANTTIDINSCDCVGDIASSQRAARM